MREIDPQVELRRFIAGYRSQREAAAALGTSAQFLSAVLNRHSPMPIRLLEQIGLRQIVVKASR